MHYYKFVTPLLHILFFMVYSHMIRAQNAVIEQSFMLGGSELETTIGGKTVGTDHYIWGTTQSAGLPVTNGTTFSGGVDLYIAKYNHAGTLLFATYFGGSLDETWSKDMLEVVGNDIYFGGQTLSTDLPVTNGTSNSTTGANTDLFLAKISTVTGAIGFCTYYGKNDSVDEIPRRLRVSGGDVYLGYLATVSTVTTTGATFSGGANDYGLTKFNGNTGNVMWATLFGGDNIEGSTHAGLMDSFGDMDVVGNVIYYAGIANSTTSFTPSTDGTVNEFNGIVYAKFDATTGSKTFLTFYSSISENVVSGLMIVDGEAYIVGATEPTDSGKFLTTNGSTVKGGVDYYALKYNAAGTIAYATIFGGSSHEFPTTAAKKMDVGADGSLYFSGTTISSDFPTTDGSVKIGGLSNRNLIVAKLSPTGELVFSSIVSGLVSAIPISINVGCNDELYAAAYIRHIGAVVTSGSGYYSSTVLLKWNTTTSELLFADYTVGGLTSNQGAMATLDVTNMEYLSDGVVQLYGNVTLSSYPVTVVGNTYNDKGDMGFARINTCPTGYMGSTVVAPASQTACINGVVDQIVMAEALLSSASSPKVYIDGVATDQLDVKAQYQWQVADSPGGPWTDVVGAISKNHLPAPSTTSKYYRRTVLSTCCGTTTVEQTGDVAAVLIGTDLAPTVNVGTTLYACASSVITLGGSPTATPAGDATIASYLWTPTATYTPNNTDSNPTVTSTASTIYQVLVTDSKGCKQIGQVPVTIVAADAGPTTASFCGTTPLQIGTLQTTVPGATYSWTSVPAGFTSNLAQPMVSPSVSTVYTLTLTIPLADGGTCTSTDAITVNPVAGPTNNGGLFAGADVTVCSGGTATLGTSAESDFTYTWAPGNYLTINNRATTTFQPGNLSLPVPNPTTYYVTALKNGCTFVDEVKATVIKADAGIDGCGPRTLGTGDKTPNLNETYTWTKVSGPGNFIGPTDQAIAAVSASVGGTTVYRLDVTLNGVTCSDEVVVPDCGCLIPSITVSAPSSCPSFDLNGGTEMVSLTTSSSIDYTYTWSPAAGLSTTTGTTVFLTDGVNRTYTVTATSTLDPTYVCSNTIEVNNPAWSLPVFENQDLITCPDVAVAIGHPTVAGYSYLWTPDTGLSANNISNPIATNNINKTYEVLVTDNGSGCTTKASSSVSVDGLPNNAAGTDFTICGAATGVKLGSPAEPNVNYVWTSFPAGAVFLPNSTVAEPMVDIAVTTTFTVVATNTVTGCSVTDVITITVGEPVAPFSFSNSTFCPSTAGAIALPAGPAGMASYSWTPAPNVLNATSNGPTATTSNPRPEIATTYTLTVTNADGCIGSASTTLTPTGTLPDAGKDQSVCLGSGSVALGSAANPTGAGITYSWSPSTGLDNASSPNPIFTPTTTGSFAFIVSKTDGGCTTTDRVVVLVNDFTIPELTSPSICQNACVQIGTAPTLGASYIWTPATGLSNANISNPIACPSTTTTYTVTGTGANGCMDTQNVIVTVQPTPAPTVIIPELTACLGDEPKQFMPTVTPAGTYNYTWTPNDGTLSNANIVDPMVNIINAGSKTYTLVVTNPTTGCSSFATTNLSTTICIPEKMSIGSTVFMDNDKNGVQSGEDEIGIGGLLVTLYKADGATVVATTYTDGSGNYRFTDLLEGNYVVGVRPNSTYTTSSPESASTATDNQTDGDNNGTQSAAGAESKSGVINLTSGMEPTSAETGQGGTLDADNDANGDMTIDFGFYNPTPLPVDLINFKATPGEDAVELAWKSANESQFNYYELQRSVDGKEFVGIAVVKGSQSEFYGYRDTAPAEGKNYYRLKMVDMDGSSKLSRIISITFEIGQRYLLVQSPATNRSFVAFTNVKEPKFELISISGVSVPMTASDLGNNRHMVEVPNITSGVYILKVEKDGKTFTQKVIIL